MILQDIKCFQSVGPGHLILERNYPSGYIQKSFLVIGDYKKIWNHVKIIFLLHPQYCPSFSPPIWCPRFPFMHAVNLQFCEQSVHFWPQRSTYSQPAEITFCVPDVFVCVCWTSSAKPRCIVLYHNYDIRKYTPLCCAATCVIATRRRIHTSPPTSPPPPSATATPVPHRLDGSTS
jgi:hypothetical protein